MQVWKYEGCRTLSYYLKRRDCLQALARDLAVPEKAVVATVMKQIFECLTVSIFHWLWNFLIQVRCLRRAFAAACKIT